MKRVTKWKLNNLDLNPIDCFVKELQNKIAVYFETSEFKKLQKKIIKARLLSWSDAGKCYFPDCNNDAIFNSHSLSNKLMLSPIAEDNQVYMPQVDIFKGGYRVGRKITLSKASIFPGFCEKHENAFTFEKKGEFSSEKELQMHLFRSICFQLHFLNNEKKSLQLFRDSLASKIEEELKVFFRSYPNLKTSRNEIESYIEGQFLGKYDLMIEQRIQDLSFTTEKWFLPNANNFGLELLPKYYSELVVCTSLLPLVLSTGTCFNHVTRNEEGTPDLNFSYFVNVFPNRGKTHIYLVCLIEKKADLFELARSFEENGTNTQKFLQDLMLRHTDNWYISPSYWDSLPNSLRLKIIETLKPKE